MAAERIFVTGMGAVTPYGASVDRLWQGLLVAEPGISAIDRFDLGGIACVKGGQIRHYAPPAPPHPLPRLDLATGFALGACTEALAQAGGDATETGLVTASNFGARPAATSLDPRGAPGSFDLGGAPAASRVMRQPVPGLPSRG